MSGSSAAVPLSILAGAGLIAGAVYLGLSHRTDGPVAPAVAPSVAPPVAAPPLDKRAIEVAALAALEQRRALYVERCWRPLAVKAPEPASVSLTFDLTFDAGGRAIARGISDHRAAYREGLSACLTGQPLDLTIAPPGADVRVQVVLTLP